MSTKKYINLIKEYINLDTTSCKDLKQIAELCLTLNAKRKQKELYEKTEEKLVNCPLEKNYYISSSGHKVPKLTEEELDLVIDRDYMGTYTNIEKVTKMYSKRTGLSKELSETFVNTQRFDFLRRTDYT